jgi:hypothetical protein
MNIKNTCPADEVFIKAFMGELNLEEVERLVDHTLVCRKCHKKFEVLRQLSSDLMKKSPGLEERKLTNEEEKELGRIARKKLKKTKSDKSMLFNVVPTKHAAVAALMIVVIAGILLILNLPRINKSGIYREERSGPRIALIMPSGKVSVPPVVFSWTVYAGADDYFFELVDDELNTVYERILEETQLTLPDEVVQKLEKGKTYVWRVSARNEFGQVLRSDFTSFELK